MTGPTENASSGNYPRETHSVSRLYDRTVNCPANYLNYAPIDRPDGAGAPQPLHWFALAHREIQLSIQCVHSGLIRR